jgi:hypothetical protein
MFRRLALVAERHSFKLSQDPQRALCETLHMTSRIEKIGMTGYALRCGTCGRLVANENDRSLIEDMQRRHDESCTGSPKS